MFNNPFDSFHNTVVEAKEKREQLDRLLTVSTPHERLLVAVIVLVLLALTAWLFLGRVSHTVTVDGVMVEPTGHLMDSHLSMQALVWMESKMAQHIEAGMPAVIELTLSDGMARTVGGEIAAITDLPLFEGVAVIEAVAPVALRRIDIGLDEQLAIPGLGGRKCRIVIELGRQPPVTLFGRRQF